MTEYFASPFTSEEISVEQLQPSLGYNGRKSKHGYKQRGKDRKPRRINPKSLLNLHPRRRKAEVNV